MIAQTQLLDREDVLQAIRAVKLLNPSEEREAVLDQVMDAVVGLRPRPAMVGNQWHEDVCRSYQNKIDAQKRQIQAMRNLLVQLLQLQEDRND